MVATLTDINLTSQADGNCALGFTFDAPFDEGGKRDMLERLGQIRIDTPPSSPPTSTEIRAYQQGIAHSNAARPYQSITFEPDNVVHVKGIAESAAPALTEQILRALNAVGMIDKASMVTHRHTVEKQLGEKVQGAAIG